MTTDAPLDPGALGENFATRSLPPLRDVARTGPRAPRAAAGRQRRPAGGGPAALADPRPAKTTPHATQPTAEGGPPPALYHNLLETDPPRHTRLRKLLARAFTARRTAALQPRVRRTADELLDAMLVRPERRADLVESSAAPLPLTVICELLGVPFMNRERFHSWCQTLSGAQDPQRQLAALEAMTGYLGELIAAKRARPR
ncbi:hypothetical protein [Streptomyces sp. SRF1]|uniref:hypothetical protein n=1 Tax=Streptomyces sp. SRF1 TaxID=1549642 RepID=UPI00339D3589